MPIAWIVSYQIIGLAFLKIETGQAGRNICPEVSHPDNRAENIDYDLVLCEVGRKPRTLGRKTDGMVDLSPIGDEYDRNLAILGIRSAE